MFAASLEEYTSTSAYGKAIRVGNLITYKIVFKGLINPSNVSSTSSNSGLFISGCPINATFDGGLYGNHGDITTLEDFESVEEGVDISDMYYTVYEILPLILQVNNIFSINSRNFF